MEYNQFKFFSTKQIMEKVSKNCSQLEGQILIAFQVSRENFLDNHDFDELSEKIENLMLDRCILTVTKFSSMHSWKQILFHWLKQIVKPASWI